MRKKTVFVVDYCFGSKDFVIEDFIQSLDFSILQKYRIRLFSNPFDVLEKLASEKCSLVISNIFLPLMTGVDLGKEIRDFPRTNIFLFSKQRLSRSALLYIRESGFSKSFVAAGKMKLKNLIQKIMRDFKSLKQKKTTTKF